MITAICEITCRVYGHNVCSEVTVACPVFDNKQVRVYLDGHHVSVPFVEGIIERVGPLLRPWFSNFEVKLLSCERPYPGKITCGDTYQEIVRDIVSTLLNQLLHEKDLTI